MYDDQSYHFPWMIGDLQMAHFLSQAEEPLGNTPSEDCIEYFVNYPPVIKHGNGTYTIYRSDFPIETSIYSGFPSLPRFDYRRVYANVLTDNSLGLTG